MEKLKTWKKEYEDSKEQSKKQNKNLIVHGNSKNQLSPQNNESNVLKNRSSMKHARGNDQKVSETQPPLRSELQYNEAREKSKEPKNNFILQRNIDSESSTLLKSNVTCNDDDSESSTVITSNVTCNDDEKLSVNVSEPGKVSFSVTEKKRNLSFSVQEQKKKQRVLHSIEDIQDNENFKEKMVDIKGDNLSKDASQQGTLTADNVKNGVSTCKVFDSAITDEESSSTLVDSNSQFLESLLEVPSDIILNDDIYIPSCKGTTVTVQGMVAYMQLICANKTLRRTGCNDDINILFLAPGQTIEDLTQRVGMNSLNRMDVNPSNDTPHVEETQTSISHEVIDVDN